MFIKNTLKKLFITCITILVAGLGLVSYAVTDLNTIQQKQRATHEKINKLKNLEKIEKNKLYKNQQKLEQASQGLQTSKRQYSNLEIQIAQMERDLNKSVAELNSTNIQMHKRIRQPIDRSSLIRQILRGSLC